MRKVFPVSLKNLPIPILIIGIYFLLTPIISYFATSLSLGIPAQKFSLLIESFTLRSKILNLLGFLLGFGILGVKRWGYFLFLIFSGSLIGHGIYLLVKFGLEDQFLWNLIITLIPFFLISYFLTREVSTPYLTLVPRGFRSKWRIEIPLKGSLSFDEEKYSLVTTDISPTGCLATVDGNIPEDKALKIQFDLAGQAWEAKAIKVREDEGKIGLKFSLFGQEKKQKQLDKFLSTFLLPRFSVTSKAKITIGSNVIDTEIINISERGAYVSLPEKLKVGDIIDFKMKLLGFSFSGKGKISWENSEGKFDKPSGYGFSFESMSNSLIYGMIIFIYTKINDFKSRDR